MANDSSASDKLNMAVDLLSSTTVVAIFYTLTLILYCLSFRLSYAQLRDDHGRIKRQTVFTLALQTVLLICATLHIIESNRFIQIVYIDNGTLPGGPLDGQSEHSVVALSDMATIVNVIEETLVLGVLCWRVWVIWSGTRFVLPLTIISTLLYLSNTGLIILFLVIGLDGAASSLAASPRAYWITSIMTLAISIASSVFMTSAIVVRLVSIRRQHIKLLGKSDISSQYFSIAAMLIESYALDTLWAIGSLISFCFKYAPTTNLFGDCGIQVDIVTNFLLIYRVLSGRAWTRQDQDRLSSLKWASDGTGTTTSGAIGLRQENMAEGGPRVMNSRNDV